MVPFYFSAATIYMYIRTVCVVNNRITWLNCECDRIAFAMRVWKYIQSTSYMAYCAAAHFFFPSIDHFYADILMLHRVFTVRPLYDPGIKRSKMQNFMCVYKCLLPHICRLPRSVHFDQFNRLRLSPRILWKCLNSLQCRAYREHNNSPSPFFFFFFATLQQHSILIIFMVIVRIPNIVGRLFNFHTYPAAMWYVRWHHRDRRDLCASIFIFMHSLFMRTCS